MVHLIKAAIAPALAACGGLEGQEEFHVHRVVLKVALGANVTAVGVEQLGFFVKPSAVPLILVGAVKEHHGALGRFGAERGALALNAFHGDFLFTVGTGELAVFDDGFAFLLALGRVLAGGAELIGAAAEVTALADGVGENGLFALKLAGEE